MNYKGYIEYIEESLERETPIAYGLHPNAEINFMTQQATQLFDDVNNPGWNEPSGSMLGNGFAWGQLAHPLAWLWMVTGLTPAEVFSFNGKGTRTQADMYDACSILCTNGATVSVSGVASIPGDNKIIDNRLVGSISRRDVLKAILAIHEHVW